MNDGFHYIDIIFFATVAAFIALRLRSVLGRRTGHERPPTQPGMGNSYGQLGDNVIELPTNRDAAAAAAAADTVAAGLARIRQADPAFEPEGFLMGARAAFEMIVGAFAAGDKDALRPLLSDDVYDRFAAAIDDREGRGEVLETKLLALRAVDIVDADLKGRSALITVRFVSDQVNVVRDADGAVVEGNPDLVDEVIDEWTFQRDVRSSDPNWLLIETRTPEPEDSERPDETNEEN